MSETTRLILSITQIRGRPRDNLSGGQDVAIVGEPARCCAADVAALDGDG